MPEVVVMVVVWESKEYMESCLEEGILSLAALVGLEELKLKLPWFTKPAVW
jgi:hypothetical protein